MISGSLKVRVWDLYAILVYINDINITINIYSQIATSTGDDCLLYRLLYCLNKSSNDHQSDLNTSKACIG